MSINLNHANNSISTSGSDADVSMNLVSKGAGSINITSVTLSGLLKSDETLQTLTGATGLVTHNTNLGQIFYHTSIVADFTPNFTNVTATLNRVITVTLVLSQGATAYMPTFLQTDGTPRTINWLGGSMPAGNANKIDIVTFSIIRLSGSTQVIGQLSSFG